MTRNIWGISNISHCTIRSSITAMSLYRLRRTVFISDSISALMRNRWHCLLALLSFQTLLQTSAMNQTRGRWQYGRILSGSMFSRSILSAVRLLSNWARAFAIQSNTGLVARHSVRACLSESGSSHSWQVAFATVGRIRWRRSRVGSRRCSISQRKVVDSEESPFSLATDQVLSQSLPGCMSSVRHGSRLSRSGSFRREDRINSYHSLLDIDSIARSFLIALLIWLKNSCE